MTASATEPAGGWNAHFDAATYTLTLRDAEIDTMHTIIHSMVYAAADINIIFQGENSFVLNTSVYNYIIAVHAIGDITIDGDGGADIQIITSAAGGQAAAIYGEDRLTILGGSLTIDIQAEFVAVGVRNYSGFLFTGGEVDIHTTANRSYGAFSNLGTLRITGGKITASVISTSELAYALRGDAISLEGGYARFSAYGPDNAYGLLYREGTPDVTGGHFKLIGASSAMYRELNGQALSEPADGMYVYVSGYTDGRARSMWTSSADGVLVSASGVDSSFHYAEFLDAPLTGDAAKPWLWAGIALVCSGIAAGVIWKARIRRVLKAE